MSEAPAFQLYAADFYMDTASWTAAEVGAYFRLLMHEWVNGPLPSDMASLARIAGISDARTLYKMWSTTMGKKFIRTDGNLLINRRLEEERQKQHNRRELQVQKGRNGARKRWEKPIAPAIAQAQPDDSSSSSSSNNTPITPLNSDSQKQSNGHPPYSEIRSLWGELVPGLPQPRPENTTWYVECKARYHEYPRFKDEGLEWVKIFLSKFADNPWWESGKWKPPGIGWVWKKKNFYSILEAK